MNGDPLGGGGGLLVLVIVAIVYMLPTIVAMTRGTANRMSVAVVNVFLGWTFVGWVVALAMAVSGARPQKSAREYMLGQPRDGVSRERYDGPPLPPPPQG